jgi:hypothetical protein
MRLFLLERTPLSELDRLSDPPRNGDAVAFLRRAQDPVGRNRVELETRGIEVLWADSLIDKKTSKRIEDLGARFMDHWYFDGDCDVSRLKDMSLGRLYTRELGRLTNPRFVIRNGEIVRQVLQHYPEAEIVFCDLVDGGNVMKVAAQLQPLAQVAKLVAETLGRDLRIIEAANPLPPSFGRGDSHRFGRIIKRYLGGFRPAWRKARKGGGKIDGQKPTLYIFLGRGTLSVARELAERGKIRIVTSGLGIEGAATLRYDHLFALPGIEDILGARRVLRHAQNLKDRLELNGITYGTLLTRSITGALRSQVYKTLMIVAQTRKLQQKTDLDGALINAEGVSPMGMLVAMNRESPHRIYFNSHGLNVFRMTVPGAAHNNPHVTYLSCGEDHQAEYGVHLDEAQRPRRPVVGNPITGLMNSIRGKRSRVHQKRLLILSFAPIEYINSARERACDDYLIDVFGVARQLIGEGWKVSFRAHPNHPIVLERLLANEIGGLEELAWDTRPALEDSLLEHDVVVSSITSVLYQTLYAGWPTVFYEPDYRPQDGPGAVLGKELMVGLPTATDIRRPVATDRDTLGEMIRETLDPHSPTAGFPDRFSGEYAKRFIGPRPEAAHMEIADFLERDLLENRRQG